MGEPDLQESLAAVANPPVYSGDFMVDRLYDMVLRLTQELAVTREELALLRQVLVNAGTLDEAELELASATTGFAQAQLESHRELVESVLGDLPSVQGECGGAAT